MSGAVTGHGSATLVSGRGAVVGRSADGETVDAASVVHERCNYRGVAAAGGGGRAQRPQDLATMTCLATRVGVEGGHPWSTFGCARHCEHMH